MVLEHSLVIARAFLFLFRSFFILNRPCHNFFDKFMATANENFYGAAAVYSYVNIIIK